MEPILVAVGAIGLLVVIVAFVISRGDDAVPIGGTGDMTRADSEARARSAGIDHLTPL